MLIFVSPTKIVNLAEIETAEMVGDLLKVKVKGCDLIHLGGADGAALWSYLNNEALTPAQLVGSPKSLVISHDTDGALAAAIANSPDGQIIGIPKTPPVTSPLANCTPSFGEPLGIGDTLTASQAAAVANTPATPTGALTSTPPAALPGTLTATPTTGGNLDITV